MQKELMQAIFTRGEPIKTYSDIVRAMRFFGITKWRVVENSQTHLVKVFIRPALALTVESLTEVLERQGSIAIDWRVRALPWWRGWTKTYEQWERADLTLKERWRAFSARVWRSHA